MTITETRPGPAERQATDAGPIDPGNWLTTGDHKRLGRLYLLGGLLSVVVGALLGAYFLSPAGAETPHLWTASASRTASAAVTAILVIGLPAAWLGLMTYVVPLQIGATRIGLPRLQSLSVWTFFAGGLVAALGYTIDRPAQISLGSALPGAAAEGVPANTATELLIVGLVLIGLATFLGAIGVATTILNHRADAMTLAKMPVFAWTSLATALVLVVSTPVFLGGLALLWVDQHYGGTFFAGGAGALRVWQHHLWVFGRPEVFLVAVPALGVLSDAVATAAGRPLVGFSVARGAVTFAVFWSLVAWATPFSALSSAVVPTPTLGTALIALPAAVIALSWLGSVGLGKPAALAGVLYAAGLVVVLALAAGMTVLAAIGGVESSLAAEAFSNAQISVLIVGAGLLGLTGGIAHWSPKIGGKVAPLGLAALQVLLLVGGALLVALPGWALGLGSDANLGIVGALGAAGLAVGVLLSVPVLLGRGTAEPDPSGRGLTLEWSTASPPPPHNFDAIPAVGSAHPLATDDTKEDA